ncbi:TPA: hypothetical protein I8271_004594 [Kluyvera intermedia]|jgi:hypothetical protein|uniref:Uncharacterized protein n=2 Tax=Enterobacteriaceae TaxID=543 RepID=A0AAC8QUM6_9ENTR|nr:hypothetical protein [Phytobacter ursingii]MDU6687044.1 hypothetical protein [Enterobacteriaceae bacterium]HAT2206982.1 hypothetical protein [Kluyvera intermedia]AKL15047.1 hypothetical protein AB182_28865 [Phytobacter ursingii]HAT2517705.1 hypothetical protein [Kluyvera intermedia]HAT2605777.1 hypothetical protein [Kluyvera intermedia]
MYQAIIYQELDQIVDVLEKLTVTWFAEHRHLAQADLFYRYMKQSQSGCFKTHYSRLLDCSMECLTGVLPQLTNRLSPRVSDIITAPQMKTRRIFSMMIYWLIQYHTGHAKEMPERSEVLDIFSSILESKTLKMW